MRLKLFVAEALHHRRVNNTTVKIESSARRIFWPFRMLDSKKPSNFIKRFQANDIDLKVTFLDDKVQSFGVKVGCVATKSNGTDQLTRSLLVFGELMCYFIILFLSFNETETMSGQGVSTASVGFPECQ